MELAETRFVRFEGTVVTASPTTPDEARLAIKELRHKKRELGHVRRTLLRQQRALARRTKKTPRQRRPRSGRVARTLQRLYARIEEALFGWTARRPAVPDPALITRELKRTDELLHNIDSCIIQLEGKLLTQS